MDTFELVKTVGALAGPIIGAVSLGWQIAKARAEKLAKPKVSTRVSGSTVEISYGLMGPLLYIRLSYRAEHRSAFVDRVEAVFKHHDTGATHTLIAGMFLEYRPDLTGQSTFPQIAFKEPFAPFGINTERYENKLLLFEDPACQERIIAANETHSAEYNKLIREHTGSVPNDVVDAFNNGPITIDAFTRIRDEMYLKPGRYNLTIRTYVEDLVFDESLEFELTRLQFDTLSNNTVAATMMPHIGVSAFQPISVNPRLLKDADRAPTGIVPIDGTKSISK